MPGLLQDIRRFPDAVVEDLGVRCPECASEDTVIVSIGDPHGESEVIHETEEMTITQLSGVTFASCRKCGAGWELERA